jgi:GT2 family glycosyltransferase
MSWVADELPVRSDTESAEPSVSIVVLHYRRGPEFATTLDDVGGLPSSEVVVVDNGSEGRFVEDRSREKGFAYIKPAINLGYGAGMNHGYRQLAEPTDYVLFLTHEVRLGADDLKAMVATAERTFAAVVGPVLVLPGGSQVWSGGGEVTRSGKLRHRAERPAADRRADWLDGAALLVRRSVFQKVGGFDPDYFLYFEDTDFGLRTRHEGGAWISAAATCEQDTNYTPPYFRARNSTLLWRKQRRPARVAYAGVAAVGRAVSAGARSERAAAELRGLRDGLSCASSRTRSRTALLQPTQYLEVVNPIPLALNHYQRALSETVALSGFRSFNSEVPSIERHGWNIFSKIATGFRLIAKRRRHPPAHDSGPLVVLWPALGYADLLTWRRAARDRTVWLVIHDPVPLIPATGYGLLSVLIASLARFRRDIRLLVHSEEALRDLPRRLRRGASTAPLPLRTAAPTSSERPLESTEAGAPVVRVLGRCKNERNLEILREIAANCKGPRFEITGKNWPAIDGWAVTSSFVDEATFDGLISTSDCIVIPYERFYQSDLATRALEHGVPIVAPSQSQTRFLFGVDYEGLVEGGSSWPNAVNSVLNSPALNLGARYAAVVEEIASAWAELLWSSSAQGLSQRWLRPTQPKQQRHS